MYCRACNVKVGCKADRCPLCKGDLSFTPVPTDKYVQPEKPTEEEAFKRGQIKKRRRDIIAQIYFVFFVISTVVLILVNIYTKPTQLWSMIYMVVAGYIYYCIRYTVIAQGNFHARVFGQAIANTIVIWLLWYFFKGPSQNNWILITWLPITYFLSELMIGIYALINFKEARKKMVSLLILCICGVIPIVSAYIADVSVKWPSIAASAFSVVVIVVTLVIGRHHFVDELKRFFHV